MTGFVITAAWLIAGAAAAVIVYLLIISRPAVARINERAKAHGRLRDEADRLRDRAEGQP